MSELPAFHRPFDTRRLGNEPIAETILASEAERAAIAAFLDILGVDRLEAEVTLKPWSAAGVLLEGRLRAVAVQACIVTLAPVSQAIDEAFSRTFLPPQARVAEPRTVAEAEVIVHFDEEDPPDDLDGPILDLGSILIEQLALALDPYPKAEGAVLAEEFAPGDERAPSAFAALSRLRDK